MCRDMKFELYLWSEGNQLIRELNIHDFSTNPVPIHISDTGSAFVHLVFVVQAIVSL